VPDESGRDQRHGRVPGPEIMVVGILQLELVRTASQPGVLDARTWPLRGVIKRRDSRPRAPARIAD